MSTTDQFWFEVTADVDSERDERLLTQARVASASVWSFLAEASTPQEFDDRISLAEERLHKAVSAVVGNDPGAHAEVYPRLIEAFQSDFDLLVESRREEKVALSRRERIRRTKDPVTRARRAAGQASRRKANIYQMFDEVDPEYAFIITKDHIDTDAEGISGPRAADPALIEKLRNGGGTAFQMFDDDGNLYYEGRFFEGNREHDPLMDFGTPYAGCTRMTIKNRQPYIAKRRKQADKWTGDGWSKHLDEQINQINGILVNQYGVGPFSDAALAGVALYYEQEYGFGWPEDQGFGSSDRWHVIHGAEPGEFARAVLEKIDDVRWHEDLMSQHAGRKQSYFRKQAYFTYDLSDVEAGFNDALSGHERLPGESNEWLVGWDTAVEGGSLDEAKELATGYYDMEEEMYGRFMNASRKQAVSRQGRRRKQAADLVDPSWYEGDGGYWGGSNTEPFIECDAPNCEEGVLVGGEYAGQECADCQGEGGWYPSDERRIRQEMAEDAMIWGSKKEAAGLFDTVVLHAPDGAPHIIEDVEDVSRTITKARRNGVGAHRIEDAATCRSCQQHGVAAKEALRPFGRDADGSREAAFGDAWEDVGNGDQALRHGPLIAEVTAEGWVNIYEADQTHMQPMVSTHYDSVEEAKEAAEATMADLVGPGHQTSMPMVSKRAAAEGYETTPAYKLEPGDVVRMPGPKDVEVLETRSIGYDVYIKFDSKNSQGKFFAPTVRHDVTYQRKTGSRKQAKAGQECPKCGSTDAKHVQWDAYECNDCGAKFIGKQGSRKQASSWEDKPWAWPEVYPGVKAAMETLSEDASAEQAAQAVLDGLNASGGYRDSYDRELAMTWASEKTGVPYNDIYDAWESLYRAGRVARRKQAGVGSWRPGSPEYGDADGNDLGGEVLDVTDSQGKWIATGYVYEDWENAGRWMSDLEYRGQMESGLDFHDTKAKAKSRVEQAARSMVDEYDIPQEVTDAAKREFGMDFSYGTLRKKPGEQDVYYIDFRDGGGGTIRKQDGDWWFFGAYTEPRKMATVRRKQAMPSPEELGVEVGDIFYTSWGYNQTNVDFFEVVRLTGASVEVKPLRQQWVGESEQTVPVPGSYYDHPFDSALKRLKNGYKGRPAITLDRGARGTAWLWDGEPVYATRYGGH